MWLFSIATKIFADYEAVLLVNLGIYFSIYFLPHWLYMLIFQLNTKLGALIFYFMSYIPKEWHEHNSPSSMAQTAIFIISRYLRRNVCVLCFVSAELQHLYTQFLSSDVKCRHRLINEGAIHPLSIPGHGVATPNDNSNILTIFH